MDTYILLLRGINVGGKNRLRMKALVDLLTGLGVQNVQTYIQSGNIVLQCSAETASQLANQLMDEIHARHGFKPSVLMLSRGEFEQALRGNPFPKATAEPASLHLGFLAVPPTQPDLDGLERLRAESERFLLIGRVFYLHAPDGVGRSKLAANSERLLGVAMSDRNWNTVQKIKDMLGD